MQKLILDHIVVEEEGVEKSDEKTHRLCSFQIVEMTTTENQK
jgi:hypothetical protein